MVSHQPGRPSGVLGADSSPSERMQASTLLFATSRPTAVWPKGRTALLFAEIQCDQTSSAAPSESRKLAV